MTTTENVKQIFLEIFINKANIARLLQIKRSSVSGWTYVPRGRCFELAALSKGKLTPEQISTINFKEISRWHRPEKRICLDNNCQGETNV